MLSIMNEIDQRLLLPLYVLYEIQNQIFQQGLCAHMLDIMSMVMACLDLHALCFMPSFMLISTPLHTYMFRSTCLYAWIHVLPCLCAKLSHVHMHVAIPLLRSMFHILVCLDLCFHMLVCLDLHFMPSSMCLCTPCHAYVPRPRLFCHAMCYCSPCVPFIAFSCVLAFWFGINLGPMVFVIVHTPWPISKGLDHPFFMSVFACFYVLCLC